MSQKRPHNNKQHRAKLQRQGRGKKVETQHSRAMFYTQVVPSEVFTWITYVAHGKLTNAGNGFATQRWHTNCPYDVDPIFGSTTSVGYAEMSALFDFVHGIEYKVRLRACNSESFPVGLYTIESTEDPGTSGTLSIIAGGNPLGRVYQLGPSTGMARQVINIRRRISEVTGTILSETADSFRSTVTSTPADKTWIGLGIEAYTPNVLTTAGVSYELALTMGLRFSGRRTLTN